jgi:transposase
MIDYQNVDFSSHFAERRISLANKVIGEKNVKKIFALTLYLNGASRNSISKSLGISYDTFKSFTDRIEREGLLALFDRRRKYEALPEIKEKAILEIGNIQAYFQDEYLYIKSESAGNLFKISSQNSMQIKTILLTLCDHKLISKETVSELLDYSPDYIQRLNRKLQNDDVSLFVDQRQGQQKKLVCEPEILTELYQQFIANLTTGRSVSSQTISENLKDRCNIDLPSRTIRYHLEKSGLSKLKKTLPGLLADLKKTPKNGPQ